MMYLRLSTVTGIWLLASHGSQLADAVNIARTDPTVQLKHWPAEAAKELSAMIVKNANQSNYAV